MMKTTTLKQKSWIQAVGLGVLALLLTFCLNPTKSYAFDIFNGEGNDGYFLSLTNDAENVRVMPVVIYDSHPKKQTSTSFAEWVDVEVNYADYDYNGKPLPAVEDGETGRTEWVGKVQAYDGDMDDHSKLGWTFPGFAGEKEAKTYNASQTDLNRAMWVSDNLVQEFNGAISFVHQTIQEYGNADLENMSDNQFANMIRLIANAGRSAQNNGRASLNYHGVTFSVTRGVTNNEKVRPPKGISEKSYVTFTLTNSKKDLNGKIISKTFIEYVPKGYRSGQPLYNSLNGTFQNLVEQGGDKDLLNLNWMLIALQSNSNWSANNVTFTNVGDIRDTNKFEQLLADTTSGVIADIRQFLGMYSASDLIMNGGTRGTEAYYNGIMPILWMDSASVLHWISYAVAWMLIIGAIVKLLVQRNIAAINPSERVDMISGIKNLMIVGFALSIYDVAFAGLTELNFLIVDMLSQAGTGIDSFGHAPVTAGLLSSSIIGFVYLCLDAYFNFYYIARALMVAILYAVGPLYVASIAFGEKYRQIFGNYVREMIGNVFVQSFQAILVVFFVGISVFGNLRMIETMVLLFCFIPMTKFFKESVGASSSATDALTGNVLGATGGLVAGAIGSQFMKRNKGGGGKPSESSGGDGGNSIQTKSGSSFGGGANQTIGSMLKVASKSTLKAGVGAGKMMAGAGLAAGGAATGMHGISQLGGYMAGSGLGNVNDARKDVGLSKDGAVTLGKGIYNRGANKRHNIGEVQPGSPKAESVQTQADGSSIQTFNKSDFKEGTGITSMRDLGSEVEFGTSFVDGQGFINGKSNGLAGSNYENKMGDIVDAFKNNNTSKIQSYQRQGIMGMKIDQNSGRVSFTLDKDRTGIGDIENIGDKVRIQHKQPTSSRPNSHAQGHANPFVNIH